MAITNTLSFIWNHPLSEGRRLANLLAFARWQMKSRLLPGPHVEAFVGDARLKVKRGQTGATGNLYVGLHELEDMVFVLHLLRPGDLFLDVGANIGSYTVLAAKVAGASVIAIEPVTETFQALLDNIALNDIGGQVDAKHCGLAAERGSLYFTSDQDTTNHVVVERKGGVAIPVVTFDELAKPRCPLLAKIDVEGFETEVLAGAKESLTDPHLQALILEMNGSGERYGYTDEALFSSLVDAGFVPYRYHPLTRALRPLEGPNRGGNTLFLRNLPFVKARIESAPFVEVRGFAL